MGIGFCMEKDFSLHMQRYLQEKVSASGTAASVAIIGGNHAAAAAVGRSPDDNAPVTINDRFGVASVSKVYCAMAVLKLVEQGRLALDTPVVEYLPRFTMRDPRHRSITLRMCLNHSSGLPGSCSRNDITAQWLFSNCYDERYDYFSKASLKAEPGAFSTYCNDGFSLAEMAVAAVSGREYMDFIREYITTPAGAGSTGDGNPANGLKQAIHIKNCPAEYVTAIGSGGIVTNLLDCARVGHLFLDSGGILADESIREIARPQGMLLAEDQGLGWDTVNFSHKEFDFGPGALGKRGGTVHYAAYLLVSREYGFSAAISTTSDTQLDPLDTLCELCAQYIETRQNRTVRQKPPLKPETVSSHEIHLERFQGVFMTASAIYRVATGRDFITLERYERCSGWIPYVEKAAYFGDGFVCDDGVLRFLEKGSRCYLLIETTSETMVIGQKVDLEEIPGLHAKWRNRAGKTYLACNMHPGDYQPAGGLIIEQFDGSGLLLFHCNSDYTVPVITQNDNETVLILDAPGYPGSHNTFAPFALERDGRELIYNGGFEYVDSDILEFLKNGRIVSDKPCRNLVYKITAEKKLQIAKSRSVRVMMLKNDLSIHYDELFHQNMPLTCDGYIVFAGVEPLDISVRLE
ncbi:serine hydrolase domain-containing protein [Brevibacillus reuszeri]|uniref:serine hydrolase domain-containing protein n=1 Tax=Brevibacillus reuszeri TaxID=54915 RepID=UPI003D26239E